jgi:hypothetical protein
MNRQSANGNWQYCSLALLIILLFAVSVRTQPQQVRIGEIEFFGTKGIDVEKVRAALPIHEGDEFSFEALPDLITKVKVSVRQATGQDATNIDTGCCDAHKLWTIYIGLRGKNFELTHYRRPPTGAVRFSPEVVALYRQTMDQIFESVYVQATEDRSKGYALSAYPPLRAKQLAMREYATHNSPLIYRVLSESADAEQRFVAAQLLGYVNQSRKQIHALVEASNDSDDTVRNNAVRALGVLAESQRSIARQIPAAAFVQLLNSGVWKDRNKGAIVLSILTMDREPGLLRQLRRQASDSLLEMARWREYGHAQNARVILGRIAGLEEQRLQKLAIDDPDEIIKAFSRGRQ